MEQGHATGDNAIDESSRRERQPKGQKRTRNGCWTCRLRRKKCSADGVPCTTCKSREILCHGYGPKPHWKDKGPLEKEEAARLFIQSKARTLSQSEQASLPTSSSNRPPSAQHRKTSLSSDTSQVSQNLSNYAASMPGIDEPLCLPGHVSWNAFWEMLPDALVPFHDLNATASASTDFDQNMAFPATLGVDIPILDENIWQPMDLSGFSNPVGTIQDRPRLETSPDPVHHSQLWLCNEEQSMGTDTLTSTTSSGMPQEPVLWSGNRVVPDLDLAMQFLSKTSPLMYLQHPQQSYVRLGWVLFLLMHSEVFYHIGATCGAAYHLAASSRGRELEHSDGDKHLSTQKGKVRMLLNSVTREYHNAYVKHELLICYIHLALAKHCAGIIVLQDIDVHDEISHYLLTHAEELDMDLTTPCSPESGESSGTDSSPNATSAGDFTLYESRSPFNPEHDSATIMALRVSLCLLIWMDVATWSHAKAAPETIKQYRRLLDEGLHGDILPMYCLIGRPKWIVLSLLDCNELDFWRREKETQGNLSIPELTRRAFKIKKRFPTDSQVEASASASSGELHWLSVVEQIFMAAIDVYLAGMIWGARPGVTEIGRGIDRMIAVWEQHAEFLNRELHTFTWPYYVGATMSLRSERDFFRKVASAWAETNRLNLATDETIRSVELYWSRVDSHAET